MSGGYLESVLRLSRKCFSGIFMLTGQRLEGIWRMYACDLLTKTFFGLQIFDMYGMDDRLGQYRSADWLFLGTAGTGGRRQLEILETGFNKTIIILKKHLPNTQDPVKKICKYSFYINNFD